MLKRKVNLKNLRKKARRIFAKWIVDRDKRCITCGSTYKLTAGHFIHKDCLDFDEIANNAQCMRCNYFMSGNLVMYAIYLEGKYGKDIIQDLEFKSRQIRKFSREELEDIILKYKTL